MTCIEQIVEDVNGMINAGFNTAGFGRDAPYPSTDKDGRVAYWRDFTPADILANIKVMYGPTWAKYVAEAAALTVH